MNKNRKKLTRNNPKLIFQGKIQNERISIIAKTYIREKTLLLKVNMNWMDLLFTFTWDGGRGRNLIQKLISFKVSKLKKGWINVLCETHESDFKVKCCEACALTDFTTFGPTVDGSESYPQHLWIETVCHWSFNFRPEIHHRLKKDDIVTTLTKIHKYNNTEFENGFVQGILATTVTNTEETILPRRYIQALKELSINENIIIIPSNKWGRIIIMDINVLTSTLKN